MAYSQSHDQVGNRMLGERLCQLLSFEQAKLAAALTLLSPFLPMLFMGQEYAETAPFLYFVSHADQDLIQAVREGRKQEFASFGWDQDPPDPQSLQTLQSSQLDWQLRNKGRHAQMLAWYQELLRLRKSLPALARPDFQTQTTEILEDAGLLAFSRGSHTEEVFALFACQEQAASWPVSLEHGSWEKILDSYEQKWAGPSSHLPVCAGPGDSLSLPGIGAVVYCCYKSKS